MMNIFFFKFYPAPYRHANTSQFWSHSTLYFETTAVKGIDTILKSIDKKSELLVTKKTFPDYLPLADKFLLILLLTDLFHNNLVQKPASPYTLPIMPYSDLCQFQHRDSFQLKLIHLSEWKNQQLLQIPFIITFLLYDRNKILMQDHCRRHYSQC